MVLNGSGAAREFSAPVDKRDWRAVRLEDPISGEIVKPAGSDAAIEVKAFRASIAKVY